MLIVVAPARMAASQTAMRNATSLRVASMAENSTFGVYFVALATERAAMRMTSSFDFLSWCLRWMSEVEIKVWSRGNLAPLTASQARQMFFEFVLARAATSDRLIVLEMVLTASKSPSEEMGKPASMMSTFNFSNCSAILTFSAMFMVAPGDCSPSRKVVSNILTSSLILFTLPLVENKSPRFHKDDERKMIN